MPMYLTKFSYTPETWSKMIAKPEDRRAAAQAYIESVGGKLHGFWYAFGTHDGYNLWEAPDNVSMAAVALALASVAMVESMARGEASIAVPIAQMGFVVTALLGFLFLREAFTARKGAGIAAALAALACLAHG